MLDTVPDVLDAGRARALDLPLEGTRWVKSDVRRRPILVSNNRYRLRGVGLGELATRIDCGLLGVAGRVKRLPNPVTSANAGASVSFASGRPPSTRSTPTAPCRRASTAKP